MENGMEKFNRLCPFGKGDDGMVVNGQKLHEALGATPDFFAWIAQRIERFGFIEGRDFQREGSGCAMGFPPPAEYLLTPAMARDLCVAENSGIGALGRKYFLSCEEKLSETSKAKDAIGPDLCENLRSEMSLAAQIMEAGGLSREETARGLNAIVLHRTGRDLLAEAGYGRLSSDNSPKEDREPADGTGEDAVNDGEADLSDLLESAVDTAASVSVRGIAARTYSEKCDSLSPDAIGERLGGLDGAAINLLLERHGYQKKSRTGFRLTKKGKEYGRQDAKRGSGGELRISWRTGIMDELREMIISGGAK